MSDRAPLHPVLGIVYYDGLTFTNPSDLDIDHVVPLAEAWRSGASSWTTTTRQAFANDLTGPQLIAVSAARTFNRSKRIMKPKTRMEADTSRCELRLLEDVDQYEESVGTSAYSRVRKQL